MIGLSNPPFFLDDLSKNASFITSIVDNILWKFVPSGTCILSLLQKPPVASMPPSKLSGESSNIFSNSSRDFIPYDSAFINLFNCSASL